MNLPDPNVADSLVAYLDEAANAAEDWYGISAALHQREQATGDIQAGWLMTAFDYHLTRRVGEERDRSDAFGERNSAGGWTYPTPIPQVPSEVIGLWASTANRIRSSAPLARLHHLLFERRDGDVGMHGREAAGAYLDIGKSTWSRLDRVNCLDWAVDLWKKMGEPDKAATVYPALVALADESLDQEKREPGVALHALEVLAFDDPTNTELPRLLDRARATYTDDPWNTSHTIHIQSQVAKGDTAKREQLNRDTVTAFYDQAMKHPAGLLRMAFLEEAVKLANQYGLPDLADKTTVAMQEITVQDLDLKMFSATASIPAEVVDAQVALFLDHETMTEVFEALARFQPPTGDIDKNKEMSTKIAEDAPLASLFPTKIIGTEGLARYTASSDEDRLDEQLARIEAIGLQLGGEMTGRVLDGAFERFSPSENDITRDLQVLPHVSEPVARSLAKALLAFRAGRHEEAATVAMPRIETMVRSFCDEKGVLRFRVQRDQRQGPSTRGQFPQLGALLAKIKPWMDQSWYRFFWTFLISPFGPNFRNELLHGNVDSVSRGNAALTLLVALRLALIPLNADPILGKADSDEGGDES